jgi:hypothetical protein
MNIAPHPQGPLAERCNLCGKMKRGVYGNVCQACAERTLRRLLPQLKRALEERYGRQLDGWLVTGRFTVACWEVESEFEVGERRLLAFLTSVIRDAFRQRTVSLQLPDVDPWVPSAAGEIAAALNERCGEALRRLLAQYLELALRGAPTLAAERDLIEVVCGHRSATRRRRTAAVEAASSTVANPLRGLGAVLMCLRYGSRWDVEHYTGVWEGEIDPVWREIKGLLPEEVRALLPEGENRWA